MSTELDPYLFAENLNDIANDLLSDITSLTVHEVVTALKSASQFIVNFADEHYSYVSKTRITMVVGDKEIDLTQEILPMFNSTFVQEMVKEAVRSYIQSPNFQI